MKQTNLNTIQRTVFFICMMLLSTHVLRSAPFVYVANQGSSSVSVIDVETNFTKTISLGGLNMPANTEIVTNGKAVYVPCGNSTVQLIDVASNTLLPQIQLNDTLMPQGIAIAPNGLYVYVSGDGGAGAEVQRINTANNAVDTILTVAGATFYDIAIAPNGLTAYVVAQISGTYTIVPIDLATNTANLSLGNILPNQGFQIIVSPDNKYLYISFFGLIRQFDISNPLSPVHVSDITDPSLPGSFNPHGLAITADGKTMYAANFFGIPTGIIPIDISNPLSPVVGTIATASGTGLQLIALDSNDSSLYVTSPSAGTADSFNITSALNPAFTKAITVGTDPYGITITSIFPPSSASGCKTKNVFLLQTDYINKITWSAPVSGSPDAYNIYRDAALTELVATIPASSALQYSDHDRNPSITYTYYITSVIGVSQSSPTSVTVTNPC